MGSDWKDVLEEMTKKKKSEVIINKEWCKGCNICITFCPKDVLVLDEKEKAIVLRPELCIGCRLCELLCPDLAVTVIIDES